jgi:O-methyltransferase involved in polyketide biosynthesis
MIAGRPSATALLVALSVLRCGGRYGLPGISLRVADDALRLAGGYWGWLRRLARTRPGRRMLDTIETLALPGLANHHCARKRWLFERMRTFAPDLHPIWVGVGFDALGLALLERAHAPSIMELDHPDSLRLREIIAPSSSRIVRHALSLPEDGERLLAICRERPSVLIVEGVAMYLPPRPLLRLLRRLAALPTPPRLLFSALAPISVDGRGFAAERGSTRRWLARQGEPFRWRCGAQRMLVLLQRLGYEANAVWEDGGFGEYAIDAISLRTC